MRCKKSDGSYTTTTWRFFYPQCTRANIVSGSCNGRAGAYVAAVPFAYKVFFKELALK